MRKGEPIGVSVTVRGNDAVVLAKRLLEAKGNQVKGRSFDDFGNFSFGILEHIDIPDVKYDPKIGILGLDVAMTLTRPGYGIRKRSKHKASIGKSHRITSQKEYSFFFTLNLGDIAPHFVIFANNSILNFPPLLSSMCSNSPMYPSFCNVLRTSIPIFDVG